MGNLNYLECNLPSYLQQDLQVYKKALEEQKEGKQIMLIDCYYCELQDDINCAEVDQEITMEQANYLRKQYL